MPSRLIYYTPKHDEIINHLIVHECGHLFRIFKCPENQRLMLFSDKQIKLNALKQIEGEIMALTSVLSEEQIAQVINIWYDGFIRQATNLPPDIMIERWIYDMIDTWAAFVNISGWFQWRGFEDVPAGYGQER